MAINIETATPAQIIKHTREVATRGNFTLKWGRAGITCPACTSGKEYGLCRCPQAREEIGQILLDVAWGREDAAGDKLRKIAAMLMPSVINE